ncbi:fatty acid desaturase [Salinibacterium sp. ZJ450]|uniref:fatty acid desaturase family protein n=2 Tax=unclassified Salinibacterium TaxID=2632331 RepID=UPI00351D897F
MTSTTLGPIRTTTPRIEGQQNMVSTFSSLLSTVREGGLLRRSRIFYISMFAVLTLALLGCVTGFILLGDSWFQLLIAGALGLVFTQFAFLAHEAAHRQVFESGPANDRAGRFIASAIVGTSYQWWMTKHTRHHANPNTIGKDGDIAFDTISFLEEDAAKQKGFMRALTRVQGYMFFPLLTLEGLNLHYTSIRSLLRRGKVDGRKRELTMIAIRLGGYLTAVFLVLPLGMAFAFVGVQMAVFGIYMGASFAPNHKGMPIIAAGTKVDFLRRQVLTSRNIKGGFWMSTLMGGLNYQVEHHLFPSMARPHLRRAQEIVREHCASQQIPYTETTLLRSYAIVIDYLNRVGLAARDPFDCPAAQQFGRG